jgi:hypothetical protein
VFSVVAADGSFAIVLQNKHASEAFNGTFIFTVLRMPLSGR